MLLGRQLTTFQVALLPPHSESLIEEGEEKRAYEKRDRTTRSTAKSESMGTNGP